MAKTYVLIHGSWHGGWCWRIVRDMLRAEGHLVFAPSLTGMGERVHLLNADISIGTFVDDVVGLLEAEELEDVILVGHSFGGGPITGVADRVPHRIRRLVYLDAIVLRDRQSMFDGFPPEEVELRARAAEATSGGLAVPVPEILPPVWGIGPDHEDWVRRRLTPHPFRSYTTSLSLRAPVGNGLPRLYVACTAPSHPGLTSFQAYVKSLSGWEWLDLATPHDVMITHPEVLTRLLLDQ